MHRGRWQHHRGLFGAALRHREELGLTPDQIDRLERLRMDFRREAIKQSTDRRLMQLDLAMLLKPEAANPDKPVDLGKVEQKIREIERARADLRILRIRTLEQGKAMLTPEQRAKLRSLIQAHWRSEHERSQRQ